MQAREQNNNYATFIPNMGLAQYKEHLTKPRGTSRNLHCGEEKGTFLACFLINYVADNNYDLDRYHAIMPEIKTLIKQEKCVLEFNTTKELPQFFNALVKHPKLYTALVKDGVLPPSLACSNGDTFLHIYLKEASLTTPEEIAEAKELATLCRDAHQRSNETNHSPLSILLQRLADKLALEHHQNLHQLVLAFTPEQPIHHHDTNTNQLLLQACLTLVAHRAEADQLLGFQAAMVATKHGMSLSQGLKTHHQAKSLLALYLEISPAFAWPSTTLLALLQAADQTCAKVEVEINRDDATLEPLATRRPDMLKSYDFRPDLAGNTIAMRSRINKNDAANKQVVTKLDVAAEIFSVKSVIETWKALPTPSPFVGKERYYHETPTQHNKHTLTLYPQSYPLHLSEVNTSKFLTASGHGTTITIKKPKKKETEEAETIRFSTCIIRYNSEDSYSNGVYERGYNVEWRSPRSSIDWEYASSNEHSYLNTTTTLRASHEPMLRPVARAYLDTFLPAVNNHENRVLLSNYYYRSHRNHPYPQTHSLLHAYLKNGGSCTPEETSTLTQNAFYFSKTFELKDAVHPTLLGTSDADSSTSSPDSSTASIIFKCPTTGEIVGYSNERSLEEFTLPRVYDFSTLKRFKTLGFDFSTQEVTQFIEHFIKTTPASPSFYHLLECLNQCGATFPERLDKQTFKDYMTNKLVTESSSFKEACDRFIAQLQAPGALNTYLQTLDIPLTSPDRINADYMTGLSKKIIEINLPQCNYPVLVSQLADTVAKQPDDNYFTVNRTLLIEALEAFIASGDYQKDDLKESEPYQMFFIAVIRVSLQTFGETLMKAIKHESGTKNAVTNFFAKKKRGLTIGKTYNELTTAISEYTIATPQNHEARVELLEQYIVFRNKVKTDKETAKGSKQFTLCLSNFLSHGHLPECVPLGVVSLETLADLLSEDKKEAFEKRLGTDVAKLTEATQPASAPPMEYMPLDGKYPPKKGEEPQEAPRQPEHASPLYPSLPAPSAPRLEDEQPQAEPLAAYKAFIDEKYENDPELLTTLKYLNDNLGTIQDNASLLSLLSMMICKNTNALAKYPCVVDGKSLDYYDLEALEQAVQTNSSVNGLEGTFTMQRVGERSPSEIMLTFIVIKQAKTQLEFILQPAADAAYSPRMFN